jgi:putative nucleotidyltransferase with HDIG domain
MTLETTSSRAHAVQTFRAEVIARKNLPTIPAVLSRIISLTEGDGGHGRELVDVVEHDQALTSKILRLANSAFFGQSRRVATIPRAVILLGFSTVRNLALGVKVWEALGSGVGRARVEELWEHAVTVAIASRTLTATLRAGDPDEAFTAGLLHDVGRLVLALRFKDDYWEAVGGCGEREPIERSEAASFGVDHAEVGGWMLEAWSLPAGIVEPVRQHHAALGRKSVAGVLAAADRLASHTDAATGTLVPEASGLLETLAPIGITGDAWMEIARQLSASEARALFAAGG